MSTQGEQVTTNSTARYMIAYSDGETVEPFGQEGSWDEVVTQFITKMNQVCPHHKNLHTVDNLHRTHICYRFHYDTPLVNCCACGKCDTLWYIVPIYKH